jgi:hypothetical protein
LKQICPALQPTYTRADALVRPPLTQPSAATGRDRSGPDHGRDQNASIAWAIRMLRLRTIKVAARAEYITPSPLPTILLNSVRACTVKIIHSHRHCCRRPDDFERQCQVATSGTGRLKPAVARGCADHRQRKESPEALGRRERRQRGTQIEFLAACPNSTADILN